LGFSHLLPISIDLEQCPICLWLNDIVDFLEKFRKNWNIRNKLKIVAPFLGSYNQFITLETSFISICVSVVWSNGSWFLISWFGS
jgi:hypothetical protein